MDWREGYIAIRELPDGTHVGLAPLTLGRLRVVHIPDPSTAGEHY